MKDYTRLHLKLCSGVKTTLHNCEKSPSNVSFCVTDGANAPNLNYSFWELVLKRELFAD